MSLIADITNIRSADRSTVGHPGTLDYWVRKLFGGDSGTLSGIDINPDSALKSSGVWAAVNIISGAIGYLPLKAYRRNGCVRKQLTGTVATLMHRRPNPYMNAIVFKETLQSHILTWGNGYAEIERNGAGQPVALWPLPPNKVRAESENNKLFFIVNQDGGGEAQVSYKDMLHIPGLGFDGIKGYSVIEYASESIAVGLAAERNAAAFFGNDSSPSGILSTDDALNKETKEAVEKGWEEKRKGTDKRYKIAVLHSGLKWQQIGIPAKDAQLIESRKFGITDVARWFSVPPHMLGDLDKSAFSNIEHQGIDFIRYTLAKWLKKWEQESDYKLFSTGEFGRGHYFEFSVDALLRGDSKTRAEVYQIALGGNNSPGYKTVNEIRALENDPPIDGGDELFKPEYGSSSKDMSALLNTAWQRVKNAEIKSVHKALKKPEQFVQWIDGFYAKHKDFAASILGPIKQAQGEDDIDSLIALYIESRKAELKNAFESNDIEPLLKDWEALNLGEHYAQV